ncbi:hypothetical protein [Mycolicibacterium stellerae]|uniref:hypothetical protein n=1 Tax=Mycolicibacterium stellerae TaxID=2358193 RepID=UPI000F0B5252|nr:hypothetical protein [Mycolicibacterium stellerae]
MFSTKTKEGHLIEGLQDWVHLSEIHTMFAFDHHRPTRPVAEAQQLTLRMIRELVTEGQSILGEPDNKRPSRFEAWDIPLDEAMAEIEHKYVTNFGDRWNWVTCAWLQLTERGKALALRLYHADEP